MRGFFANFGIASCGLATSILVAIANVAVARVAGFDFFTFSVWVILPAGAMLTGLAAASGYYFGSLYFHRKATTPLLVQMVLIAGLTQLLIYWLGYSTLVLDDGRKVADLVPFREYLDVALTKAHYRLGNGAHDIGEVGALGYGLAVIQFLGFLAGGLAIYVWLQAKPVCQACDLYLRPIAKKQKTFADADAASSYYDRLLKLNVDGPEFAKLIRLEAKIKKPTKGALLVNTTLMGCPKCKCQMIDEKVKGFTGREWKDLSQLDRCTYIQSGIDLAPIFRS